MDDGAKYVRRALPPAVEGCLDACARCLVLLDLVGGLPPETARRVQSALGPHLRHAVDHLRCLMAGIETGRVDYDARERSVALEREPRLLREALWDLMPSLGRLAPSDLAMDLVVLQTATAAGPPVATASTLGREIVFAASHTIHHIAMCQLLAERHGVAIPEDLTVAHSTAVHRRTLAAGA